MRPILMRFFAVALLLAVTASTALADPWYTKGGTPARPNYSGASMGFFGPAGELWRLQDITNKLGVVVGPGQSATQPVVVDGYIYHLAGKYLWRISLGSQATIPDVTIAGGQPVNTDPRDPEGSEVRISSSTPTYSPDSGILYFGTGYGWLYAYDTRTDQLRTAEVDDCPIVSSPLVLRIDNRDVVVVGDKDSSSGSDGCLPGHGGRAWIVWGLDETGIQPHRASFDIGGWVTPSAVPGSERNSFIIGADGSPCVDSFTNTRGNGKVLKLSVIPAGASGAAYQLVKSGWGSSTCVDSGQAGNFASSGDTVYWVDVGGQLWARRLADGVVPQNWPRTVDVPKLIGGPDGIGFTNTEPAIDVQGNALYVTLRNFVITSQPGRPALRGCGSDGPVGNCPETGAPGAIAAIHLDQPTLKWQARLPDSHDPDTQPSINTAPLALYARGAVLFGDVNGQVHSYALNSACEVNNYQGAGCETKPGSPWTMYSDINCQPHDTINLLQAGETPARGAETWSQVSGVGTDPMVTPAYGLNNPLLLMGVNYAPPFGSDSQDAWRYGRLIAIRAGDPYDLTWTGPTQAPAGPWTPGQTVTVTGQVVLTGTDRTLDRLRTAPALIRWFMVSKNDLLIHTDDGLPTGRELGEPTALPAGLQPDSPVAVAVTFQVQPDDPTDGQIVGVIDIQGLMAMGGMYGLVDQIIIENAQIFPKCPSTTAAEIVYTVAGGPSKVQAFADNYTNLNYTIDPNPTNLTLQIDAPASVNWAPGGSYPASFRITNTGAKPASVPLAMSVQTSSGKSWSLGAPAVTAGPGETVTLTRNITMIGCGTATVSGSLNPDRSVTETDYTDNAAAGVTAISGECGGGSAGGGFQGGDGHTQIVPDDCIANPDPTSSQPCLNYPNLIIPR